jgi:hypothetical protein
MNTSVFTENPKWSLRNNKCEKLPSNSYISCSPKPSKGSLNGSPAYKPGTSSQQSWSRALDYPAYCAGVKDPMLARKEEPYTSVAAGCGGCVECFRAGEVRGAGLLLRFMEAWRRELEEALRAGLEDSEDDFEQVPFPGLFELMLDESTSSFVRPRVGGSTEGRRYFYRERELCHERLYQDYFAENPTYDALKFRRRFRMRRDLFLHIVEQVCAFDPWFIQKRDAAGRPGLSSLQKCTAAIRMLAYGIPADATDEYCRTGESTAIEAMKRFTVAVRGCFESTFLRQPSREDFLRQIGINVARGFPGMFGSLDCMHWTWKNCLVVWQGQFQDKDGFQSVILEAIADHSLWIWHAFFGFPGGNNDMNVLDRSPLVANLLTGDGRAMTFEVNGHVYNRYYLLTDGIYPQWSCFLQPIHERQGEKKEHFTKMQFGRAKMWNARSMFFRLVGRS